MVGITEANDVKALPRSHFQDADETFIEVVMDSQVSKVAAAEILLSLPQYIIVMTMRWQEREGGKLGSDSALDPEMGKVKGNANIFLTSAEYILHAIRLFVSLCPTFRVMQTSLAVFDQDYERMLVDALTMVLLSVSSEFGKRRMVAALGETSEDVEGVLARDAAAMLDAVPAAIHAMLIYFTEKARGLSNNGKQKEHWKVQFDEELESDVVHERLELIERGWMFLPAAVEGTRTLGQMLLFRLREENSMCFLNAGLLAQRLEFSIMLLEQIMVDENAFMWFCKEEGNVTRLGRLVCTVFDLVTHTRATSPYVCRPNDDMATADPVIREPMARPKDGRVGEWFYDTDPCRGYAGFAVSQMCALLVSMAFHDPSFTDLLMEGGEEARTVVDVMLRAVLVLGKQVLLRPSVVRYEVSPGESQLMINFMRLSEIISDDTNFKATLNVEMIEVMKQVICQERGKFRSMWGPMGAQAVLMMGRDKHTVNSISKELRLNAKSCKKAVNAWMSEIRRTSKEKEEEKALMQLTDIELERGVSLALERAVLLIKLIGNLQMQHKDGGGHTFGGLLATAIKEMKCDDKLALLDAKENIEWLVELAYEFRGEGKMQLVVPLLDETELRFIEIFKESADDVLQLKVTGLGAV